MYKYLLLLFLVFTSCNSVAQLDVISYPIVQKEPVIDYYHGIRVIDDYRNLENLKDSTVRAWLIEQGRLTESIMDTISEIDSLRKLLSSIQDRTKTWAKDVTIDENGNIYFLKRAEGERIYILYKQDTYSGEIIQLYDPRDFRPEENKKYIINYIQPSWNGRYIGVSLVTKDNFASEMLILDLDKGIELDYTVKNLAPDLFGGIQWLPNNSSFTYLRFPVTEKGLEGYKANSVSMIHKIGHPDMDFEIFGNNFVPVDSAFFPTTKLSSSKDKYMFGYIATADNFYDAYYCKMDELISGKPNWRKMYELEDKVLWSEGVIKNNRYYYLSPKYSANYQLLSVDMDSIDFESPSVEVEMPQELVLEDFEIDGEGIYFSTAKHGVESSLYYKKFGEHPKKIEFPIKTGSMSIITGSTLGKGALCETDGWVTDLMRYYMKADTIQEQIILAEIPEFPEFKSLRVNEIEIEGHDGEMIPVSLIYDEKVGLQKPKPAMIISYGAYGSSQNPFFSPFRLSWVAQNGIIAVAHIRGGGEKGESWHEAGRKENKHNSWKDIISVTEYLIEKNMTDKEKTVIYGSSAGAISSGMAVIERPDLFNVFLAKVPFINPSRSSAGSYKKTSYLEFGDIENPLEAKFLLEMDPYLNLKKGVNYPATLLIPSERDDRLDLWESGKFIAKLQEYSTSGLPALLDVNITGGHSGTSAEETSKAFGFARAFTE